MADKVLDAGKEYAWLVTGKGIFALEESENGLNPIGVASLDQLSKHLQKGYKSPKLMSGCIGTGFAALNSGPVEYYIYELPSGPYILRFDHGNKDITTHEVSLPNMYFVVSLQRYKEKPMVHQAYLIGSPTPIKSFDDPLCVVPIPNIGGGGSICWGTNPLAAKDGESSCDFGARLLKHFFDTKFNNHLWPVHAGLYDDWTDWEAKTKKDPQFMTKMPLRPSGYTINSLLRLMGIN